MSQQNVCEGASNQCDVELKCQVDDDDDDDGEYIVCMS
jgi:hypothetical protein